MMSIKSASAIIGTLASVSASAALAGNIEPAPTPTPVIASALVDWSGPFVGAQFGGGFGNTDFKFLNNSNTADHSIDGTFGGIYGGYDFQSGANVFGFDLSYNFSDITGSTECPNPAFTCSSKLEDFGSVRGRYGRTLNDFLVYGAAGYAFGNAKADARNAGGPVFRDNSAGVDGWTVAAGVQKMLQSGWALRGEVAYYNLSAGSGSIISDVPAPVDLGMDMTTVSIGIEKRW
ncbi:outer membrane beta-barrel protein [Roseovarius sp. S4756]|uniref:outer membrane beta-barrel protein n=1 Tax=Roseovarius maritimus TaxID=3342637 RepID=UPI00372A9C9A